jgi:hypothetical protein
MCILGGVIEQAKHNIYDSYLLYFDLRLLPVLKIAYEVALKSSRPNNVKTKL